MIELRNVSKTYKTRRKTTAALKDINLVLPDNGIVCLVGESGCGKTTLLNMLGTLDTPTGGDILVDGKSIVTASGSERNTYRATEIGFVFQDLNLVESLTVYRNLLLVCNKSDLEEKYKETLQKLGIDEFADKLPKELSGGQRQRVAIARALVKGSRILLCDEPTGSLDPDNAVTTFELLKEISKERLVVVVSHDVATASKYADRMIRLHKGEISEDTPNDAPQAEDAAVSAPAVRSSARSKAGQRTRGLLGLSLRYTKCKPGRLAVMTVVSVLLFMLLSIVSAVSAYDRKTMIVDAMQKNDVGYFAVSASKNVVSLPGSTNKATPVYEMHCNQADIEGLAQKLHCTVDPIYPKYQSPLGNLGPIEQKEGVIHLLGTAACAGVVRYTSDLPERYGYRLYGRAPVAENEVVLGGYLFELYKTFGYAVEENVISIDRPEDMIGKQVKFAYDKEEFTVTGVLDTQYNAKRYAPDRTFEKSEEDKWRTCVHEFYAITSGSPHSVLYIGDALFQKINEVRYEESEAESHIFITTNRENSAVLSQTKNIREQTGGFIWYAPNIDEDSDAIFLDDRFFRVMMYEFTAEDEELMRLAYNYALQYPQLFVTTANNGYVMRVPFGGIYFSKGERSDMYWQNDVKTRIVEEYKQSLYNVSYFSKVLVPAKEKSTAKRMVRYDRVTMSPPVPSYWYPQHYGSNSGKMITKDITYTMVNEAAEAVNRADKVFSPIAKYMGYAFWGMAVLAVAVIYLYFSALLSSREKDVGVLRTNGYTKWEIALLFIFEALLLSVGFMVLSIITSAIVIPVFVRIFNGKFCFLFTPISFTIREVGLIVGFQLLFSAVGILIPLLLLLRKKPMEIINAGK